MLPQQNWDLRPAVEIWLKQNEHNDKWYIISQEARIISSEHDHEHSETSNKRKQFKKQISLCFLHISYMC